jgi:release factor glutamine methyltransferase
MEETKTLGEVLTAGAAFLEKKGVENPRLAVELLAARLLSCKRLELPLSHDRVLDEKRLASMRRGVKRVAGGEPVQYVIGSTEFMGHEIKVDSRALVPRPETEVLVTAALSCEDLWQGRPAVVDIGTGSGCIVISLALAHPQGLYIGIDRSEEALSLARENAVKLGVDGSIGFACSELADMVEPASLDAIVSNPPYIPTDAIDTLPVNVRDHEPRQALDGGPDGMSVLGEVVLDASMALKPGGHIFLEIGEDQAEAVTALLANEGFADIAVSQDLAGRDRVVQARLG